MYRLDASHLGGEHPVVAWQRRCVAPFVASSGDRDIGEILEPDGKVLRALPAPSPQSEYRSPVGPIVVWPDESLVIGVLASQLEIAWLDLEGTAHRMPTEMTAIANERGFQLASTGDGNVLVSAAIADASPSPESVDWPLPVRLELLYSRVRRYPFDDHEHVTACFTRTGKQWQVAGRVAAVADDIVICEVGSGAAKQIVGRRTSDGAELWRIGGADRFVLGTIPMPAWSDERVYVVERGARRREAWAREYAAAVANDLLADNFFETAAATRYLGAFRDGQPLESSSTLSCLSTKTGDVLWQSDVDGDIVSFFAHPKWFAVAVAGHRMGALCVFSHDGTPISSTPAGPWDEGRDSTLWPPDPSRWPHLAAGDDDHVIVAENRSKRAGGSRIYCATLDDLSMPMWEAPLPAPCVTSPMFRWLRLLNQLPMVFTGEAAFLRWGKNVHGYVTR